MVEESNLYGLPLLSENPFSTRPLEAGELGKLVGRETLFTMLKNYVTLRSSRRILLVGPLGSGRTSLLRCLTPYSGESAYIGHLSANAPAKSLLEMMYQGIMGIQAPSRRDEVVKGLVDGMYGFGEKLPLIVIDVPASDMSVLNVALRDTLTVLERLNALVILVCDQRQRQQLPQELSMAFEEHRLSPFTPSDVLSLVKKRLASVGCMDSDFTMQDATRILEQTDGYPALVIKELRNAVDVIRMGRDMGVAEQSFDTSARLEVRDGPSTLDQLMTSHDGEVPLFEPSLPTVEEPVEVQSLEENAEIIDASIPWDERTAVEEDDESAFGSLFDLDIGALDEAQELDEPLQVTPFDTPIIDASASQETPYLPPPVGNFGGLIRRNKGGLSAGKEESDHEQAHSVQQHKVETNEGNEYWIADESPPVKQAEEFNEDESAALIHDEVGFVDEALVGDGEMNVEVDEGQTELELNESNPPSALGEQDVMNLLARLLESIQSPKQTNSTSSDSIMAFFESKRRDIVGPKESHPLDKHLLSSLSRSEAYVVGQANDRNVSPSDEEMLAFLSIKRARLSQICNRLLRGGILQARKEGRHRKYALTQSARAQLEAWGSFQRSASL
ncbi:hypothetical protein N9M83_01340 [Candidatus Poseidonia alphae]|nr:hypothetical protein [Candidatus Poseidonia alphae]MDA8758862.1 hypothetical protein [Candidatus Poseidonia alphae]MDB2569109.1 hypothetical protein [Candidatus Poseidonia alphae]